MSSADIRDSPRRGRSVELYKFAAWLRKGSGTSFSPIKALMETAHPVLVIEDDQDVRESVSELLGAKGFYVRTASNGLVALEYLRAGFLPRVILLDLVMPEMDGWAFRAEQLIHPTLKDVPTIVTSASGFSGATLRERLGAIHYMPKPTCPVRLVEAVDRLSRRAPRET